MVQYEKYHTKIIYIYKISGPTWNEHFELPDGWKSVSDIQVFKIFKVFSIRYHFEYIIKKHKIVTDNPPIRIYINKIENIITFKINKHYYLEVLTIETMKLLGRTKSKITKDENGKNVPRLEITEVVLVHCNIVNNHYQQDSRDYMCSPWIVWWINRLLDGKDYGFLSFAINMKKKIGKNIGQNWSNKYSQNLLDHAKKWAIDTLKAASKTAIQKTAEATGYFMGYKIADKITKVLRKSPKNIWDSVESEAENIGFERKIPKERYISP